MLESPDYFFVSVYMVPVGLNPKEHLDEVLSMCKLWDAQKAIVLATDCNGLLCPMHKNDTIANTIR